MLRPTVCLFCCHSLKETILFVEKEELKLRYSQTSSVHSYYSVCRTKNIKGRTKGTLLLPGMELESETHSRLSVVSPEHCWPTGNKTSHWRVRNWVPERSQPDHSDQWDQLSVTTKKSKQKMKWLQCSKYALKSKLTSISLWIHRARLSHQTVFTARSSNPEGQSMHRASFHG